jgi:hypothetical protein
MQHNMDWKSAHNCVQDLRQCEVQTGRMKAVRNKLHTDQVRTNRVQESSRSVDPLGPGYFAAQTLDRPLPLAAVDPGIIEAQQVGLMSKPCAFRGKNSGVIAYSILTLLH